MASVQCNKSGNILLSCGVLHCCICVEKSINIIAGFDSFIHQMSNENPVQDHSVRFFIHEYISILRLHIQFYITSKIDLSWWWLIQKNTHTA